MLRKCGGNIECFFTSPFPHAPICRFLKSLKGIKKKQQQKNLLLWSKESLFQGGEHPWWFSLSAFPPFESSGCACKAHSKMGRIKIPVSDCRNKKQKNWKVSGRSGRVKSLAKPLHSMSYETQAYSHTAHAADPEQLTIHWTGRLTPTQIPEGPVGRAQAEQIWIAMQRLGKLVSGTTIPSRLVRISGLNPIKSTPFLNKSINILHRM